MKFMWILCGILISCFYMQQVNSACLCGAIGENYCNECKSIRPVPKFRPDIPAPTLNPIGDKCSCGKQLVEPAIQPRTCCCSNDNFESAEGFIYDHNLCSSCAAAGKPLCNTCKASAAFKLPPISPCEIGPWIHANAIQQNRKCGIPADPISVSLAHRSHNALSFSVPEEKVQYGHRTTPLCPLKRIYYSNIPEENLWTINRQIIELKKKGFAKKSHEDIIGEDSEEEDTGPSPNYLTYGELGYCPEKFNSAKFIGVPGGGPPVPECMLPPLPIGNCGFKPGAVVPFNLVDPKCTMEDHFELV